MELQLTQLPKVIRFKDLQAAGICNNRVTLARWQNDPKIGFPRGRLSGPNTRTWTPEEISAWYEKRPTEAKPDLAAPKRGGAR
jgi:hypothetical protein